MKHSEREHLKENELARALAAANQTVGLPENKKAALVDFLAQLHGESE